MAKDIILDSNNDILIQNGDFFIGKSLTQDGLLILSSNTGEWKSDPLLGCNLTTLNNSSGDNATIERRIKMQLERDGKDYDNLKQLININVNES